MLADRLNGRRQLALAAFIPVLEEKKTEIDKIKRKEFKYGQKNRQYVSPCVASVSLPD